MGMRREELVLGLGTTSPGRFSWHGAGEGH